jgi:NADPH:quinone reductase-like Zn-dependent oxidoreductase
MQAAIYTSYGPPEVVRVMSMPDPIPQDNEVLIRVHASTVNGTDCGFRSAEYFISRFWSGLFKPKRPILGCEFAGEVIAIGNTVTQYKIGDRVFGFNDKTFGGHAELLCQPENAAMDIIPAQYRYEQAAALTEGSHYALNDIYAAKVRTGQHVLVYGATGAIGSAAIQILKHMGAHVTAVCGTPHIELVRSLGADIVIDYMQEDYTKKGRTFDFVFDAVGKTSFGACKPVLNKNGIYISTELGKYGQNVWLALFKFLTGSKKVLFPLPVYDKAMISYIRKLAEEKHFTPVIDKSFRLSEITAAHTYVDSGQKIGNVIILCGDQ